MHCIRAVGMTARSWIDARQPPCVRACVHGCMQGMHTQHQPVQAQDQVAFKHFVCRISWKSTVLAPTRCTGKFLQGFQLYCCHASSLLQSLPVANMCFGCRFLRSKQPTSFPGSFNNPIGEKGSIEWNYVKFLIGRDGQPMRRYKPQFDPLDFESDVCPPCHHRVQPDTTMTSMCRTVSYLECCSL